jgi:hypothetical protein
MVARHLSIAYFYAMWICKRNPKNAQSSNLETTPTVLHRGKQTLWSCGPDRWPARTMVCSILCNTGEITTICFQWLHKATKSMFCYAFNFWVNSIFYPVSLNPRWYVAGLLLDLIHLPYMQADVGPTLAFGCTDGVTSASGEQHWPNVGPTSLSRHRVNNVGP